MTGDLLSNSPKRPDNAGKNITVVQGEIEVSNDNNVTLTTILGSCISVCMWDKQAGIGGMNHFLLAEGGGANAIKYGAYAMEMLINKMLRAGANRSKFQSKVFGGASVSNLVNDIGQRNGEFALDFLSNEGIPCLAESIGGNKARRVRFHPATGSVKLLFVQPADVAPIRTASPKPKADITLF